MHMRCFLLYITIILGFSKIIIGQNEIKVDSISPNWAISNATYVGNRLYPQYTNEEYLQECLRTRIFLALKIQDTLVIVTDDTKLFNHSLNVGTKTELKHRFKGYQQIFKGTIDDLPIYATIKSKEDLLFYTKFPREEITEYELESAFIKSDSLLVLFTTPLNALLKEIAYDDFEQISSIIVIRPSVLGYLWCHVLKPKYNEIPTFYDAILFNIDSKDGKKYISSVTLTILFPGNDGMMLKDVFDILY